MKIGIHKIHNKPLRKMLKRYWRPRRLTLVGDNRVYKWLWFYIGLKKARYVLKASYNCGLDYNVVAEGRLTKLVKKGRALDAAYLKWVIIDTRNKHILKYSRIQKAILELLGRKQPE